jgi:dTDP-glucose 4,6-dehydratase
MKNIMVTGALGFIGSNFVNYLSDKYPDINIIILDICDYCSSGKNVRIKDNIVIVKGDICDVKLITETLNKYNIDTIVNMAALSHVDNSFKTPLEFTRVNTLGTHNIMECCRLNSNIKLILHMSTDEVYGDYNNNCDENTRLEPNNPYSASKAGAEHIVKAYYKSYNIPCIIVRCNNVYGINQFPEKIIPKFIMQIIKGKKVTVHGKGESKRSFIHVSDVCRAIDIIINKGNIGEIYNINSDNERTVMDIAISLCEIAGVNKDETINYVEDRPYNDRIYSINGDKLRSLGWKPEVNDFHNQLKYLFEWYKLNGDRYVLNNI